MNMKFLFSSVFHYLFLQRFQVFIPHFFGQAIPRYFIFPEAIVNGSVSMISFFCRFAVGVQKSYLCKLILYPAILPSLKRIISRRFLVEFLRSLVYDIMSSANGDLDCSFSICIPSSCLIAPASILSTMLKMRRNCEHSCLISDFYRFAPRFSLFRMMLTVGFFVQIFYWVEVFSLQPYNLQKFYHDSVLDFVKGLFCIY